MAEVFRNYNGYRSVSPEGLLGNPGQFVTEKRGDRVITYGVYEPTERSSYPYETHDYGEFESFSGSGLVINEKGVLKAEDENAGSIKVTFQVYSGIPLLEAHEKELMQDPPLHTRRKVAISGIVFRGENPEEYYLRVDKMVPFEQYGRLR